MYSCPKCKSENVQTFKMACISGTSSSEGFISGITTDLDDGFLAATSTITKSSLTQSLAPPQKKKVSGLLSLLCFFCFPLLFWLLKVERDYKAWNNEEYPKLLKEWENSWICLKCGQTYIQYANEIEI